MNRSRGRPIPRRPPLPRPRNTPLYPKVPEMDTASGSGVKHVEDEDNWQTTDSEEDETETLTREDMRLAKSLVGKVGAFFRTLKPVKHFIPDRLREEMVKIELMVRDFNTVKIPADPIVRRWSFDVYRLPMETWKKRGPPSRLDFEGIPPALIAYYQIIGGSSYDETGLAWRYPCSVPESGRPPDRTPLSERNMQRVVIMSDILHEELLLLTSEISRVPIIVAPPYKLFVEYLPQLKERLARLETELEELQNTPARPGVEMTEMTSPAQVDGQKPGHGSSHNGGRDNQRPSTHNLPRQMYLRERIPHLRCLTEFVDNELEDLLHLRLQITNCCLEKVGFEDLWYLFRPGDVVYSIEQGKEQLSKIYFVAGGQMRKRNRVPDDDAPNRPPRTDRESDIPVAGSWTPLNLCVYTMEFDGKEARSVRNHILVHHYPKDMMITELPAYPLQFHPDKDILDRFESRGRRFMSSPGHRYYDSEGLAVVNTDASDHMPPGYRRNVHHYTATRYENIVSDVYVDFEEFYQSYSPLHSGRVDVMKQLLTIPPQDPTETSESFPGNQRWAGPPPPVHGPAGNKRYFPGDSGYYISNHSGHEVDKRRTEHFFTQNRRALEPFKPSKDTDRLTPEFYQLLPYAVPGYAFRHRKWYLLDIDLLQDINPDRYSGFEHLVIASNYKDLLTALVNNHTSGVQKRKEKLRKQGKGLKESEIDVVPGKGEGLIILLHGPPGSGKTSTAETIAAYTKRPLYSITCGDIGLDPEDAESKLEEHTVRADKWGCVLLLDEADVFLMQRTWKEIERNVLVSIFLRQLEYYSGILFLTTNRPGTIDEAFKSRIHVSLRYPGINLITTIQMWNNILARITADNATAEIKVVFDRPKLLAFAEKHCRSREQTDSMWNGRQIRNAFQTAIALGQAERMTALHEVNMSAEDAAAHRNQKKWMTVKLTVRNFRRIAETTNEFEDYMVSLRGKDADNARETEVRDDNYDPHPNMSTPGQKNYGQGSAGMSSTAMGARGGSGWGQWGESATAGGRGGRKEMVSYGTPSSGSTSTMNVGKGNAGGRQTAMDSEEHDEDEDDEDDDDDEDEMDNDR